MRLHEQEKLYGPMAGAMMYVAMEYNLLGDKKKAKLWAKRAKKGLRLWSGEGHEYDVAMGKILGEQEYEAPYKKYKRKS